MHASNAHVYPALFTAQQTCLTDVLNKDISTVASLSSQVYKALNNANLTLVAASQVEAFRQSKTLGEFDIDDMKSSYNATKLLESLIPKNVSDEDRFRYVVLESDNDASLTPESNSLAVLAHLDGVDLDITNEPYVDKKNVGAIVYDGEQLKVTTHVEPDLTDDAYYDLNQDHAERIAKLEGLDDYLDVVAKQDAPTPRSPSIK